MLYFEYESFTKVIIRVRMGFRGIHKRSFSQQVDMVSIIGLINDGAIGLASSLPYLSKDRTPLIVCDPAASCIVGLKGLFELTVS
jgi:hypothetical protein